MCLNEVLENAVGGEEIVEDLGAMDVRRNVMLSVGKLNDNTSEPREAKLKFFPRFRFRLAFSGSGEGRRGELLCSCSGGGSNVSVKVGGYGPARARNR